METSGKANVYSTARACGFIGAMTTFYTHCSERESSSSTDLDMMPTPGILARGRWKQEDHVQDPPWLQSKIKASLTTKPSQSKLGGNYHNCWS